VLVAVVVLALAKRKKGMSKVRDPESGSARFEFTLVAVFESADDARQGTVCGDYFRVADDSSRIRRFA
jgi:hypothetical protein